MSTLPFLYFLFIKFQVPYLYLSEVSPWSTLHLKAGAVPSLDLSFLDQATPHVEPPSRPPTELDVVVALSTISHLLSLGLFSLSIVQKTCFSCGYGNITASLEPKAGAFISRVINRAPKLFSSIEHVVTENAQVIFELEELMGKKYEYEQFKLSTNQSIQKLEEINVEHHAQEEQIKLLAEEIEREKTKLSSLIRQGEVLHTQGLNHQQKTISLGDFLSSMKGKADDLTSQLQQINVSH